MKRLWQYLILVLHRQHLTKDLRRLTPARRARHRHAPRVPVYLRWGAVFGVAALVAGLMLGVSGSSSGNNSNDIEDGTGPQANQTAAQAAADGVCELTVPANPFTVGGLATPYVLTDGCSETNPDESAFVQATILAPNGAVAVYSPLVITAGTQPISQPVPPVIPAGSTVGIWFGYNGVDLHLIGPGSEACSNGLPESDFGQFASCGATAFFAAANAQVTAGTLKVPPLGVDFNGAACPTVNSFDIVDQDPNDNVQTSYLVDSKSGRTMQDTVTNRQEFPDDAPILNPSDNTLTTDFVDPAIGCFPWKVLNLADDTGVGTAAWTPANSGPPVASLALDQLQAAYDQAAPVADVELSDEMTLAGAEPGKANQQSIAKTNLYREEVDQPDILATQPAAPSEAQSGTEASFCTDLNLEFPAWLMTEYRYMIDQPSPVPDEGNNLYTFMAERFVVTWSEVLPFVGALATCTQVTGINDAVTTFINGDDVAIAAEINGAILPPGVSLAGTTQTTGDQQVFASTPPTTPNKWPTTGATTTTTTAPPATVPPTTTSTTAPPTSSSTTTPTTDAHGWTPSSTTPTTDPPAAPSVAPTTTTDPPATTTTDPPATTTTTTDPPAVATSAYVVPVVTTTTTTVPSGANCDMGSWWDCS
jgi:hypothetical protein